MIKPSTLVAVLAAAVALASCAKVAEGEAVSTNGNVQIERLTQVDGCTIYRFYDAGRHHYTTICRQGTTVTPASMHSSWSEYCGKGCTKIYNDQIDTVVAG